MAPTKDLSGDEKCDDVKGSRKANENKKRKGEDIRSLDRWMDNLKEKENKVKQSQREKRGNRKDNIQDLLDRLLDKQKGRKYRME